jgi:L-lactate dehydrogenase (cytochrome)/glycolate oxidase
VENVLDIMRMGIDSALLGMGVGSVRELAPEHLLVPDDFYRVPAVDERSSRELPPFLASGF